MDKQKKVRIFPMILLLLGICSNGYAQEENPSLPVDPLTEEYYQAYKWFYYDSYQMILKVIGNERMALPLVDFGRLSLVSQYNICSVSSDYIVFYSTTQGVVIKILAGVPLGSLVVRLFADLSGISWDFRRKLSEDEKNKISQSRDLFKNEQKLRVGYIKEKTRYCFDNQLIKKSGTFGFTEGYASVPMEFQVRDIYRSQVPLIRWIQENVPESEEKDNFQTMVESMERKYSVF